MTETEKNATAPEIPKQDHSSKFQVGKSANPLGSNLSYTVSSPVSPCSGTTATANIGTTYLTSTAGVGTPTMSELPTVYLPPIHYTYDRATGKLVEISRGEKGPVMNMPIPSTSNLTSNAVYTTVPETVTGIKERVTSFQTTSQPANVTPRLGHAYHTNVSHIPKTGYQGNVTSVNVHTLPTQYDYQYPAQTFGNTVYVKPDANPVVSAYGKQYMPLGVVEPSTDPRINQQPPTAAHIPVFGDQQYHLQQKQMTFAPQPQQSAHTAGVNYASSPGMSNFASSMKKGYDSTANAFRSFDNASFGTVTENIKKVFHPDAYPLLRAVVFRLQRLEYVPLTTQAAHRASYSLVGYFDADTENYDVYHSAEHWAFPSDRPNQVNCDLGGDVVRIPWQGEKYVFLKVVEHINQLQTVVGRLKLHIDSLVRQHPLRINIISDANTICGHVILEFDTGSISQEEMRTKNEEALHAAELRRSMDYQRQRNRMPDYDTYMKQHKTMQRDNMAAEYAPAKPSHRQRAHPPTIGDVPIPAVVSHFVRWCCDITDSDLY